MSNCSDKGLYLSPSLTCSHLAFLGVFAFRGHIDSFPWVFWALISSTYCIRYDSICLGIKMNYNLVYLFFLDVGGFLVNIMEQCTQKRNQYWLFWADNSFIVKPAKLMETLTFLSLRPGNQNPVLVIEMLQSFRICSIWLCYILKRIPFPEICSTVVQVHKGTCTGMFMALFVMLYLKNEREIHTDIKRSLSNMWKNHIQYICKKYVLHICAHVFIYI